MLLKIKLDWENPDRLQDSTLSLIAKVLSYQEQGASDGPYLAYSLAVRDFEWELVSYNVKTASLLTFPKLGGANLIVELEDEDVEILNIPIESCEVVENFPPPSLW
jgi:hypothetical protein